MPTDQKQMQCQLAITEILNTIHARYLDNCEKMYAISCIVVNHQEEEEKTDAKEEKGIESTDDELHPDEQR